MKRFARHIILLIIVIAASAGHSARALSFDLDSIAAWGRFPRFCINVYQWGDKFFNSQNPEFVVGTGKRFSLKLKTNVVSDIYDFSFDDPNRTRMLMMSNPTTSVGFHLNYMAVSIGYDLNVGKYFGGGESRQQFNFQFNCSLFAADFFYNTNNIGSDIRRFGPRGHMESMNLKFDGIDNRSWGLDTYYFFNNKNYSQAAAYSFGKIQRKSSGSLYAGLSISHYRYNFNFASLPSDLLEQIPLGDNDYLYRAVNRHYGVRIGYAYNWVFHKGWTLGISESPIIGFRTGWVLNKADDSASFAASNRIKASIVYNRGSWFFGAVGRLESYLIYNKAHTMVSSVYNFDATIGFRFNLW